MSYISDTASQLFFFYNVCETHLRGDKKNEYEESCVVYKPWYVQKIHKI